MQTQHFAQVVETNLNKFKEKKYGFIKNVWKKKINI